MNRFARLRAVLILPFVAGCFSMSGLDETGTDVTQIRPGMTRDEIEQLLGPPLREQAAGTDRTLALYSYDAVDPEYGTRAGLLVVDILTIGTFSLFCTLGDECPGATHESRELILVYDAQSRLLEVQSVTGAPGEPTQPKTE